MIPPMDPSREERRRAQLETFIGKSARTRRVTLLIGAAFAAAGVVLHLAGAGGLAGGALLLGLFIAGTGIWISGGHIRDFEAELRAIEARRPTRPETGS